MFGVFFMKKMLLRYINPLFVCKCLLAFLLTSGVMCKARLPLCVSNHASDTIIPYEEMLGRILDLKGKGLNKESLYASLSAYERLHLNDFNRFMTAYLAFDVFTVSALWEKTSSSLDSLQRVGELSDSTFSICGDINLRWGMMYGAVGQRFKAFKLLQKAKYYAYRYKQIDSRDWLNKRTIALLHLLFSKVPDRYVWVLSMLGLQGDINEGLSMLQEVMVNTKEPNLSSFRKVQITYWAHAIHMGTSESTLWSLLNLTQNEQRDNVLMCYVSVVKEIGWQF